MSDHSANGNGKVVDLKSARKRSTERETSKKRSGATGNGKGHDAAYGRALKAQRGVTGSSYGSVKWFHYIQVVVLLVLVAWMMRSCNM